MHPPAQRLRTGRHVDLPCIASSSRRLRRCGDLSRACVARGREQGRRRTGVLRLLERGPGPTASTLRRRGRRLRGLFSRPLFVPALHVCRRRLGAPPLSYNRPLARAIRRGAVDGAVTARSRGADAQRRGSRRLGFILRVGGKAKERGGDRERKSLVFRAVYVVNARPGGNGNPRVSGVG
jgi:hypothetical protein